MRFTAATSSLFDRFAKGISRYWPIHGIGAIFSMALLSVVSSMVLELTARVSLALWGSKIVNSILGNSNEGLTNMAMQQGGIGLLLTVLFVSVPPMAAIFFQETLGNFLTYSAFGAGGASAIGPQGQPPGPYGTQAAPSDRSGQNHSGNASGGGFVPRVPGYQATPQADAKKPYSATERA